MNTIESLAVRTNAAMSRLSELQRRAEKLPGAQPPVVRPALKELTLALEELQVANEQLAEQMTSRAAARHDVESVHARHREFINSLPLACVWTDERGVVEETNDFTARLLNVSAARLPGKPLGLYVTSRAAFFDAINELRTAEAVDVVVEVRPRERKPKKMRLVGQRLQHDARLCWFLRDARDNGALPAGAAASLSHDQSFDPPSV